MAQRYYIVNYPPSAEQLAISTQTAETARKSNDNSKCVLSLKDDFCDCPSSCFATAMGVDNKTEAEILALIDTSSDWITPSTFNPGEE